MNKGVVVTNSIFTNSAKELAKKITSNCGIGKKYQSLLKIIIQNKNHLISLNQIMKRKENIEKNDKLCPYCSHENTQESKVCGKCGILL